MRLPYIVITCARISAIKRVCSVPPCCLGAFLDLLSVHNNFGDEDGIFRDILSEKVKDIPKQDPHDISRCQTSLMRHQIRFETSKKVHKFAVGTDFEAYAEQLEFFFVVSGVTESKEKKAVLLTNLPNEKYQLAKDLMVPILLREDSLTYDTNVEGLQKQLKP